jgi:hypothetical protein
MANKTVYILGAGFSMDAGAPSQAEIVQSILELKTIYSTKKKVHKWVDEFENFLSSFLLVKDAERNNYALEDIYTPIDKSISEGISFRNYTPSKLVELRDNFNRLIILAVRNHIEKSGKSKDTIEKFAQHIVKQGRARLDDEKIDNVAVITTNWDIMLDNAVNGIVKKEKLTQKQKFPGVVDYCCYISSLDENDHKIKPGLYALGKGGYNVKILKLHGSLNWLQCPKCQRIYVKFYTHWPGGYVFNTKFCRHCDRNYKQNNESNRLYTNLIMPTFLKNLNNVQNKLIWQNAGIELAEASKVVFLGYSLPAADFEFKQLLSRMIRSDAKIEAVLRECDDPAKATGSGQWQTAGYRYQNFFSGRDFNILYGGVKSFVNSL